MRTSCSTPTEGFRILAAHLRLYPVLLTYLLVFWSELQPPITQSLWTGPDRVGAGTVARSICVCITRGPPPVGGDARGGRCGETRAIGAGLPGTRGSRVSGGGCRYLLLTLYSVRSPLFLSALGSVVVSAACPGHVCHMYRPPLGAPPPVPSLFVLLAISYVVASCLVDPGVARSGSWIACCPLSSLLSPLGQLLTFLAFFVRLL